MEVVLTSNLVLEFHYLYCEAGAWFNIKLSLLLAYNIKLNNKYMQDTILSQHHVYRIYF